VEIRETGKSMRGDVTIACIQTVGVTFLPAVVQRYAALYPDNRIRVLDNPSAEVTMTILRREAEFGINMQGTTHPELAIRKRKVKWRANYEVQRSSTALGMVARGVGATIVPEIAVQGEDYPRLRAVPLVDPVVSRTLVLVSRANGHLAPAAQALYDLMRSPLS
jgi:DNA-binding transcriptional LysR family regulator